MMRSTPEPIRQSRQRGRGRRGVAENGFLAVPRLAFPVFQKGNSIFVVDQGVDYISVHAARATQAAVDVLTGKYSDTAVKGGRRPSDAGGVPRRCA